MNPTFGHSFTFCLFRFPGHVFVDQKKLLYKVLGCKKGISKCFSSATLKQSKIAYKEGYRQGIFDVNMHFLPFLKILLGAIQGDPLQLGGVFVIAPSKGLVYK